MSIQVKAVYEHGVFRPLQSVDLQERQEVTVTIHGDGEGTEQVLFVLSPDRWRAFCDALDAPPRVIPALRKLLTEASVLDANNTSAPRSRPA
jgi:predicted DNA-binding antitoxin AbrB/MazE fold protein